MCKAGLPVCPQVTRPYGSPDTHGVKLSCQAYQAIVSAVRSTLRW